MYGEDGSAEGREKVVHVMTTIQIAIERQRKEYAKLGTPLLQFMVKIHNLSQRQFAEIFGISKFHAEDLLKHRVMPSLELAVRIARYFETNVDELFAWRVDDTGDRRPLVVEGTDGKNLRLTYLNSGVGTKFSGLEFVKKFIGGENNGESS